ncbi:unnamed protein product [Gongylonema pulchrum]|uniref:Roadblock/LC7 domain-containing protein n=1 Tax=Gongylonema pulchrum TaxID=637853 RepID=A0A183CYC0_9BILA|nr:unnamed protein product [Gongylonema pulchrum]
MSETFRTREPVVCSLSTLFEDLLNELTQVGISSGHSFVALLDSAVVGVALNSTTDVSDVRAKQQEFTPVKDYGPEISGGHYRSKKANQLRAFFDAVESGLKRGIDKHDNKIFKINVLCVHGSVAGLDFIASVKFLTSASETIDKLYSKISPMEVSLAK